MTFTTQDVIDLLTDAESIEDEAMVIEHVGAEWWPPAYGSYTSSCPLARLFHALTGELHCVGGGAFGLFRLSPLDLPPLARQLVRRVDHRIGPWASR